MRKGRIRALAAIPGPASRDAIVRDFCRSPEGVVSAFDDAILPGLKSAIPDDTWIDVKPFGEIVRMGLEMCGETALPLAPTAHYHCAVAAACESIPEGSPFFAVRRFVGFHDRFGEAIKELWMWGVGPEEAFTLAGAVPDRLGAKLRDVATVGQQAQRWLNELGREIHAAQLVASLQGLPERDGSLERLLVFVGAEVAPMRMQWLEWIAEAGVEVTVVFDRDAAGGGLFPAAARARGMLDSDVIEVGEGNGLQRNLFRRLASDELGQSLDDGVVLASAPDVLYEVEFALRAAASYGPLERTAILCRDLDQYGPLIDAAAWRLEVPIVLVRREPLLANAFARLTLAALEFCVSSDVRDLIPIARSSYLGLDSGERQALLGVVREAHRLRSEAWSHLASWAKQHEETVPWLVALLDWRLEVQALHVRFAEWCGHLRTFIGRLPWAERRPGLPPISNRDVYAQSALLRALSAYASVDQVATERPTDLRQFATTARLLWERADVAVPRADYGVFVGGQAASLPAVDQVIVLGLLEGTFPRRRSEDAIFTDDERATISHCLPDRPALETSFDQSAAERDEFYRVCSSARRRLVLSYPLAGENTDNVPAFYLGEVRRIVPGAETISLERADLAPTEDEGGREADRRLRSALEAPPLPPVAVALQTDEGRRAVQVPVEEPLTPEQLRDAARCPFAFAARHRLSIQSGRALARWNALLSLPQKSQLPAQPNLTQARYALETALAAQLEDLYAEIPAWELNLLASGGKRLIEEWLAREHNMRYAREEHPVAVNVPFDAPGFRAQLHPKLRLAGSMPAVSSLGGYRAIHLYRVSNETVKELAKWGNGTSDEPLDAKFLPTRLLIGLYFWAAYDANVCPAIVADGPGGGSNLIVHQRARHPANLPPESQITIYPLVDQGKRTSDWVEAQVAFTQTTKAILRPVLEAIREGNMVPTPQESVCPNCEYGELCRRSQEFGEEEVTFG